MIEINKYNTFDESKLKESWNGLVQQLPSDNIHLTWEWLSSWWQYYGEGKNLYILTAEEEGHVLGIFPLMKSKTTILPMFHLNEILFAGTGLTDYHEFILPDRKEECIDAFFKYMKNESWHIMRFRQIPEISDTFSLLEFYIQKKNPCWGIKKTFLYPCPYLSLEQAFESYYGGFKKKKRYNINRQIKQLNQQGTLQYRSMSLNSSNSESYLNQIFKLHQERWRIKKERCQFPLTSKVNQKFFKHVTQLFGDKNQLKLFMLHLDEELIAYIYGFQYNHILYDWNTAYHPQYHPYSVGKILHRFALEELMASEFKEFDFMRGAEPYKMQFTKTVRNNYEIAIYQKNFLGYVSGFIYLWLKPKLEQSQFVQKLLGMKWLDRLLRKDLADQ